MTTRRRTDAKGFTLIEVLLALGLSAAVLSAVYFLLYGGAKSWKRMHQRAEVLQTGRVALERIESDLRNALQLSQGGLGANFAIKGDSSSLSFPAMLSVADPSASQPPFEHSAIGLVKYSWGNALERDWALLVPDNHPSFQTTGKDAFPPFISNVSFSYAYQNKPGGYPPVVWQSQWFQSDRIPQGVRVNLVLKRPDTGEQITLSKTISVPHGMLGDSAWISHAKS